MSRSKTSLAEAVSPSRMVCFGLAVAILDDIGAAAKLRFDVAHAGGDGLHVRQVLHRFGIFECQFLAGAQLFGGPAER